MSKVTCSPRNESCAPAASASGHIMRSRHALLLLLALLGESSADQPCPFTESEACSFACSLENIRSGCLLSGQPCIWCSTLTTKERCRRAYFVDPWYTNAVQLRQVRARLPALGG